MLVGRNAAVHMGVKVELPSMQFMPGELNSGYFCLCFTHDFSVKYGKEKV